MPYSGALRHAAFVRTDISEERVTSIFGVEIISELARYELVTANVLPNLLIVSTLMIEAIRSSDTSVHTRATRRRIREDDSLHIYTCSHLDGTHNAVTPCTGAPLRLKQLLTLIFSYISAGKSHRAKMQRSQSKILRMITNVPWYVTNQTLHDDPSVPFIEDIIQEKSINHHDKLGNHSNPILQPLLEQQQRRRLKNLWPADLLDG
jgi:hypothetical protein